MIFINHFIYIYILIFEFEFNVVCGVKDNKLFPNLPVGEFRVYYKAIIKCDTSPDNKIHHNLYFSKLSTDTVALKGNFTYEIPYDDSLTAHINLAIKDSVGGWKDNAHIITLTKACSTFKKLFDKEWRNYTIAFGMDDHNCPIIPGVYASTKRGYDLSYLTTTTNFPKTFFYGTYKTRFYYKDVHNVQHGCINFIAEVKRPWETD